MRLVDKPVRLRPYKAGDRLRHETLGMGTFVGHGKLAQGVTTYAIRFDTIGLKELMPAFAHSRLRKVRSEKFIVKAYARAWP